MYSTLKNRLLNKSRSPHYYRKTNKAFTLLEVIIAMTIFGVVSLSLIAALLQSRRMADTSIYRLTAYTIAQGYIEQIMSHDYNTVLTSMSDNSIPLDLKSISPIISGASVDPSDDFYINTSNTRDIIIDVRGDTDNDGIEDTAEGEKFYYVKMPMTFKLTGNQLPTTGADPYHGIEFELEYTYKSGNDRADKIITQKLQFVKSEIKNY